LKSFITLDIGNVLKISFPLPNHWRNYLAARAKKWIPQVPKNLQFAQNFMYLSVSNIA